MMSEDYKVQLDSYNGPLDLLLFLIRREEVDIYDIPIARITEQYLAYVELLKKLDPNYIGEFLVMAATLMEMKSRLLVPTPPPEEDDEEIVDPRLELVHQLLEYKKFKDAAQALGASAAERANRFGRIPMLPQPEGEPEVDLDQVQVWDLLSAFSKVLRDIGLADRKHEVFYDDTPIALHAADIADYLEREGGSIRFEQLFEGRSKGEIIGLFLALLELVRAKRVRAEQEISFETIILHLLDSTPLQTGEIDMLPDEERPAELEPEE
ncbi:MAG: segregation/condensation protein A [Planctomycetota bacterium]|nr:segregation/condensation protein A [Planctomycetota bacterium]